MREQQLARERDTTLRALADNHKAQAEASEVARRAAALDASRPTKSSGVAAPAAALPQPGGDAGGAAGGVGEKRRNRWDTAPKCVACDTRAARCLRHGANANANARVRAHALAACANPKPTRAHARARTH
jgi:hypothetical protein